jgi:hypothetical protein
VPYHLSLVRDTRMYSGEIILYVQVNVMLCALRRFSRSRSRLFGVAAAAGIGAAVRNDIARDIIAGFASVTPTLAGVFRLIDAALADLPADLADPGRARAELEAARLDRANLLAAMRATVAAHADREPDPFVLRGTSWRRARRAPRIAGRHREQLPADAPPVPAGAQGGHAAHDGDQLR